MAAVHAVLVGVLLLVLARTIRVAAADGWPGSRALFFGTSAETLLITSVFWGYGGCLAFVTMFGASFHRHYLIVIAPILALWAALAVLYGDRASGVRPRARAVLLVICVGQAVLSAGLLSYIHSTAVIRGEYGATWRSQQPGFVATEP
jgi:hypothetical protein